MIAKNHQWTSHGFIVIAALSVMLSFPVMSQSEAQGPQEAIRVATDNIIEVVREAPSYYDSDPDRYFAAIGAQLDAIVDWRGFAKGVMGDYASGNYFRSLDAEGQAKLRDQLEAFTVVMREGLIRTYSRGLLAFGGSEFRLLEEVENPGARVQSLTQLVTGDDGSEYVLRYQMGQYRDGSWKLRNLIIENINLGEIYRGQFAAAASEADGDLDSVIATWNVDDTESEAEEDAN